MKNQLQVNTLEIGQKVVATLKKDLVWNTEIVDIATNGVWVDHPELGKEDMLYIDLTHPMNNIEIVEDVKREASKEMELKEAHKALDKAFKWVDEDIKVSVKIYDCFEEARHEWEAEQSYDVEISWAIGDEVYTDCVVVDVYTSNLQDDEVSLKEATKRAKAVLRTVKGWYQYDDQVTVTDTVEVYHA